VLLGIVGSDGLVGYVRPELIVDAEFVRTAAAGRRPEKRLRFAQPCVESGCGHWLGSRCAVVERMIELQQEGMLPGPPDSLPRCTIRSRCRWFSQRGRAACNACPYVVTDLMEDGSTIQRADVPLSALAEGTGD
jgi:hypothetical protein